MSVSIFDLPKEILNYLPIGVVGTSMLRATCRKMREKVYDKGFYYRKSFYLSDIAQTAARRGDVDMLEYCKSRGFLAWGTLLFSHHFGVIQFCIDRGANEHNARMIIDICILKGDFDQVDRLLGIFSNIDIGDSLSKTFFTVINKETVAIIWDIQKRYPQYGFTNNYLLMQQACSLRQQEIAHWCVEHGAKYTFVDVAFCKCGHLKTYPLNVNGPTKKPKHEEFVTYIGEY